MKLRRLTVAGLVEWRVLLDEVHHPDFDLRRRDLVDNAVLTEELGGEVEFTAANLETRFAIASYLDSVIGVAGIQDPEQDAGLWSWLTLAAFEHLCARHKDGSWNPMKRHRWIFEPRNYMVYYRHLLGGPYAIYRAHHDDPGRAIAVLCGAVGSPGEAVEQLASTQAFVASKGVMRAATLLYYDKESCRLKSGHAAKRPGTARRMAAFLNQIDLTWDLFTLTGDEILDLMPPEFDRFKTV